MTFREQIARDNACVFLNEEEFADRHIINGTEMPCMIDNNEMVDREKRYRNGKNSDGMYLKELLVYVKKEDFGVLPAIGRVITFDKKSYIVTEAIDEGGIFSLSLEANKL